MISPLESWEIILALIEDRAKAKRFAPAVQTGQLVTHLAQKSTEIMSTEKNKPHSP